jgi:hypothetical protein
MEGYFNYPLPIAASHQLLELVDSIEEWNKEGNEND